MKNTRINTQFKERENERMNERIFVEFIEETEHKAILHVRRH